MKQQQIRLSPTYSGTARSLSNNVLQAIPKIDGEIIIVIEDDDWYGPRHIEDQVDRLLKDTTRTITGHGLQEYYHLPTLKYKTFRNIGSCFCQVAFRRQLLPELQAAAKYAFERDGRGVDRYFWERVSKKQWNVFYDKDSQVIGMKGLPGRAGLGMGHRQFQNWTEDPNGDKLRDWVGKDSDVYLRLREEQLNIVAQERLENK